MKKYLASKVVGRATKKSSNRGASLPEVLIGAALISTMVAAAGYGLSSMVTASTASNARSDKRAEQTRSLDFVAAEIRESASLVVNAQSAANPSSASGVSPSYAFSPSGSGAIKVLMVNPANVSVPVVYYVATPPAGSWKGPRVLYRWGPSFDAATGNYSNASTPNTWTSEVLIDNIPTASAATSLLGGTPGADRNCTSTTARPNNGGTYSGDSGFNACVDAAGRTAVIYQDGQVAKVLGTSENYTASTNTGSRGLSASGPAARTLPAGALTATLPDSWTLDPNGTVTTAQPLTMSVRYLGGDIVCGNPSYPIPTFGSVTLKTGNAAPVTTNLNMTPGVDTLFPNVAANTAMTISGKGVGNSGSGACNGSTYGPYSSTNTTQVRSLKNGDNVPPVKGYLGQASIDAYLTSASTNPATGRPIVNTTTRKIDLAANQVIYLFELGVTDPSSAAFDIQDMVVLATFK
jgi:hypothetical protein